MTKEQLLNRIVILQELITPTEWVAYEDNYQLSIKPIKPPPRPDKIGGAQGKTICVICRKDTYKTIQRRADAELICLLKNSLPLIREALEKELLPSSDALKALPPPHDLRGPIEASHPSPATKGIDLERLKDAMF